MTDEPGRSLGDSRADLWREFDQLVDVHEFHLELAEVLGVGLAPHV